MLNTLLKIGEWQSEGKSEWDRFLDYPKVDTEDKRGNKITNYTLPIIFDLDNKAVIIDAENLEEYDEKRIAQTISLKIKGGNNKAIYTSVPSNKLQQIYKTFFGKEGEETETGQLFESIEKTNPDLLTDDFKGLLSQLFSFKEKFLELTSYPSNEKIENGKVDIKTINETFDLNKNEKIVFVVTKVKSEEYGYDTPVPFPEIPAYKEFLNQSYFGKKEKTEAKSNTIPKLCYASGNKVLEVEDLQIDTRFGLNKMFVTTTQNYASRFDKKNFNKNYQVSLQNQKYLDLASEYLLKKGYVVRISNVEHVIIPEFQSSSKIDFDFALDGIQRKTNLLFKRSLEKLDFFRKNIQDELENNEVFWINFLAFDTDRKGYFKSTEIIKDISNFHFQQLLDAFFEIDSQFEENDFVNWNKVMTNYNFNEKGLARHSLNFNSLYEIIPIKEKSGNSFILKNIALELFKTILENRKVKKNTLYKYFTELILCHYYPTRYKSYTNVHDYSQKGNIKRQNYFKWAVRDSVFKYLAFFQLLKKLKLIDMEDITTSAENINQYNQLESDFFKKMDLNQEQCAMFYLGRMLNQVEYIQTKDKKKKTVIEKVNFNGLELGNIQRLRNDLNEKAKQYRLKYPKKANSVVFIDNKFASSFDYNRWTKHPLNPQEALFFLLTGYSFGAGKKNETNDENE